MSITTIRGVVFASLSAAAALANVAVAVPAHAAEPSAPTASVRYADLDLATPDGVARLDRRIRIAAKSVCGEADPRDLARMAPVQQCRAKAIVSAAPQIASAIESAHGDTRVASNAGLRVAGR